ncbi:MAG: glycosyltransferase family 9 protein [Aquificaceae bacterium]
MLLFYRRGGLGDTLLTFPILEMLKRSGKRIWAVGNTDYFLIAKEVGWVDFVSSEMPQRDFEERILLSHEGDLKPFPQKREWIVNYYLRSLKLKHTFSKTLPVGALEKNPLKGYAVLHPSSGSFKKNPPLELFLWIEDFLKKEGFKTIYLIGEADQWLKAYVKNYWESFSPLEMAKALKEARLFVGNDSGVSHLASYCGVLSFIFYGPTDFTVWKPIGEKSHIVSAKLPCSPCFPHVCSQRECLDAYLLFKGFLKAYRKVFNISSPYKDNL